MSNQTHTPAHTDESAAPPAPQKVAEGDVLAAAHALADALARKLAPAFADRLGAPFRARVARVTLAGWREFLADVADTTCCFALSSARPPEAPAAAGWIEMSRPVAFACLQQLLGCHTRRTYIPERSLTGIERKVVARLLSLACDALGAAWSPKAERGFQLPGGWACASESAEPGGGGGRQTVVASFHVSFGGQAGRMRLCLGPGVLAEIADRQLAERDAPDGPLELSVTAAEIDVPSEDVAHLAPGDIVPTDTLADGEVIVRLAGIPKFAGRLGSSGGRRAVTILRPIAPGKAKQKAESGKRKAGHC